MDILRMSSNPGIHSDWTTELNVQTSNPWVCQPPSPISHHESPEGSLPVSMMWETIYGHQKCFHLSAYK